MPTPIAMNAPNSPRERLDRLSPLLQQDPGNVRLLADAADCALAAGVFDQAEQYMQQGLRADQDPASWQFRIASLRIAQRRLPEARVLLEQLNKATINAGIAHNLAYVNFLEGNFEACSALLEPWLESSPAAQSLWLRALHHQGRLKEAWAWVEARPPSTLSPATAAAASLIALDLSRLDSAHSLADAALAALPSNPEAGIAMAGVLLARGELARSRELLGHVTSVHPHQARAWSTLGYVALLELQGEAATKHFGRALDLQPHDIDTQVALGWAHLLNGNLVAAKAAFENARAHDDSSADAHGGLAVAQALQGDRVLAAAHAQRARKLQPGNVAARHAEAILSGNADGLKGIHRLMAQLLSRQRGDSR